MKTVADFEPLVIADSAGAEEVHPTILHELIRESIIAFMQDSRIAMDEYYFKTQCNVTDYILDIPKCHRIVGVEKVAVGDKGCVDVPMYDNSWTEILPQDNSYAGKRTNNPHGYTIDIHYSPNSTLILPDTYDGDWVYVSYSFSILRDDCDVPDFIYNDWAHVIVAGAVYRLKRRIGQPNNIEIQEYEAGVHEAKVRKTRRYNKGRVTLSAPSFLGRRR